MPSRETGAGRKGVGVLAGRVIDERNQLWPKAAIVAEPEGGQASAIEAMADEQGYFLIQGLQPGKRYKLTATAQSGGQRYAGVTVTTPPNATVVIRLKEGLPTPEPSGGSGAKSPAPNPPGGGPSARQPRAGDPSWSPESAPKYLFEPDRGSALDRIEPQPLEPIAPAGQPPAAAPKLGQPLTPGPRPPAVPWDRTAIEDGLAKTPPRVHIGGPQFPGAPETPVDVPAPHARDAEPAGVFCRLNGGRLEDFALKDLQGQLFQFRKYRGKLTLIDCWGSWCVPCTESLGYFVELQRRYGKQGLDVIGIAYEAGTWEEQVESVHWFRRRHNINYKLLLGGGDACPFRQDLRVKVFPTLILVDENGEIVFRADGVNPQTKARLEAEIRKRLEP